MQRCLRQGARPQHLRRGQMRGQQQEQRARPQHPKQRRVRRRRMRGQLLALVLVVEAGEQRLQVALVAAEEQEVALVVAEE